jgi:hypothetical protein
MGMWTSTKKPTTHELGSGKSMLVMVVLELCQVSEVGSHASFLFCDTCISEAQWV